MNKTKFISYSTLDCSSQIKKQFTVQGKHDEPLTLMILGKSQGTSTTPTFKMAEVIKINQSPQNGYKPCDNWDICLHKATSALKKDRIIAVPTDTIYGIAGLAQSSDAIGQIYDIKSRDVRKPVAICVGQIQDVNRWGRVTVSDEMLHELLPGPVTLVFERTRELNTALNPDTSLVGIRIPDNKFIRDLCNLCGEPLALTSANVSSTQSTLNIAEFKNLWDKLELICDGGVLGHTAESRLGSTVVDLSRQGVYTVIRPGSAYEPTIKILTKHHWTELKPDNLR